MLGGSLPRGLHWMLLGSAVLHGGVLVGVTITARSGRTEPVQKIPVLVTKLVRLGKERPKELLPRLAPEPVAPEPTAIPVLTPDVPSVATTPPPKPTAEPAQKPKPATSVPVPQSARDRVSELGKVRSALDRVKRKNDADAVPEGHPEGTPGGEATDLSRALIGNKFATEVYRCLKENYAVEGVEASKLVGRTATVVVRVASDGKFIDWKVEQSSGLEALERAVERAVKLCGRVGPPDAVIREQVRKDGIEIEFNP